METSRTLMFVTQTGDALRELVTTRRRQILDAAARHHGRRVRIFGSVARGDAADGSDVDFLVDFDEESSLFDLMHLSKELEDLLGRPVDVVSAGGLKPRDRHLLEEAVDL